MFENKPEKKQKDLNKNRGKRAGPKPATPERLERAALHYLERYASSAENLRRVLMRRVHRSAELHGTDVRSGAEAVDALIERYQRAGLLDDKAYASARVASLHRQGKSKRAIRQTLSVKGVEADIIDAALEELREEYGEEADFSAAINYARRRRIGPWRRDKREAAREKDMAALGRQGFGYDLARRIVDAASVEELEEDLS